MAVRITAQSNRCINPAIGKARMHPAKKAQIAVCKA
jgi:hypothetical protein